VIKLKKLFQDELYEEFGADIPVECGDGWYNLIYKCLEELEKYNIEIAQIKEKYGELRIYVYEYNPEVEKIIEKYSKLSTETCEICGQPGVMATINGWTQTLCDRHR
jgi:hypothetical protein